MKKIIKTDAAGLRSPYEGPAKDLDVALVDIQDEDHPIRIGKPMVFSSTEFNEGLENADEDVKELINTGGGGTGVKLTVNPSTSDVTYTPSTGEYYNEVEAKGVTSTIDANILASNIKEGVTILGVTGTYVGGGIIERGLLASTDILEGDITFDAKYEYREPTEFDAPDTPNHKEIDIWIKNNTETSIDLSDYVAIAFYFEDYEQWPRVLSTMPPTLDPFANYYIAQLDNAYEPEEGQTTTDWTRINELIAKGKAGELVLKTSTISTNDVAVSLTSYRLTQDWDLNFYIYENADGVKAFTYYGTYRGSSPTPPEYEYIDPVSVYVVTSGDYYSVIDVNYISTYGSFGFTMIPDAALSGEPQIEIWPASAPVVSSEEGEYNSNDYPPYTARITFDQPVQLAGSYSMPTFTDPNDPTHIATASNVYRDSSDHKMLCIRFDAPQGTDWMYGIQGTLNVEANTVVSMQALANEAIEIQNFEFIDTSS